jgi:electron transfer flavoprotein-quinone oxidoreductase
MHQFLKEQDPELLFDKLPRALNEAAYNMFLVDGVPKADKQKLAVNLVKGAAGGTLNLMKLGYKGWRAMNG